MPSKAILAFLDLFLVNNRVTTPISSTTIVKKNLKQRLNSHPAQLLNVANQSSPTTETVRYKLNEVYDAGELCVFMIKFESGNLGIFQQNVSFEGYGAVVIFRTNTNSGTGFQLSFKQNSIQFPMPILGTNLAFNDESDSPLHIPLPSNVTGYTVFNYFVFTSGSKLISDPDTLFGLSVKGWYGHEDICSNASGSFRL
ncbi:hypothetical protein Ocin01_18267 [Orchesella cincta]|uniref:Uncharacterized protein n=1 Tax=Orchesella cincta TaxID=48709 RepID=A0A1D2M623_ORCCI|nr:hypothetical protein Ocin01_18267 [Orchesella cincta]